MRRDCTRARFGRAKPTHDQRHTGAQRLCGGAFESRDALDVFDQHQDRGGLALIHYELGEVARRQARLVARRDDVAE